MRFGFRVSRGLWVSLPWWLFPVVLTVLLAEAIFYLVMLALMALMALVAVVPAMFGSTKKAPPSRS